MIKDIDWGEKRRDLCLFLHHPTPGSTKNCTQRRWSHTMKINLATWWAMMGGVTSCCSTTWVHSYFSKWNIWAILGGVTSYRSAIGVLFLLTWNSGECKFKKLFLKSQPHQEQIRSDPLIWNVPLQHNLKSESLLHFSSLRCANVRTKHNNSNGGTPTTQKERWLDKTPQKKLNPNAPLHSWSRRQGTISARFKQYTDNPPTHEISFWSAFWQAPTNNACTQINVDKHTCQNLAFFHPCLEGWRVLREWSRVHRVCALEPSPGLGNHEVIMSVKRKATLIDNKANGFGELFDHIMELL